MNRMMKVLLVCLIAVMPVLAQDYDARFREYERMATSAERDAALRGESPATKAALFRRNIASGAIRYDLSPAQLQFVRLVYGKLSELAFIDGTTQNQDLKALDVAATNLFPDKRQAAMFSEIGNPDTVLPFSESAGLTYNQCNKSARFSTVGYRLPESEAFAVPSCNCSVGSWFNQGCANDCAVSINTFGEPSCFINDTGCGFLGIFYCNGWCYKDGKGR